MRIKKHVLPDDAFLQTYAKREDCFSDCYKTRVKRSVSLEDYITAFYSTRLFRTERMMLGAMGSPSTDADLAAMARGQSNRFAAWSVEDRKADQILLSDKSERTRSWLMVKADGSGTQLFFGSAVVPKVEGGDLGFVFRALLGFHKLYSRALLKAATSGY